MRRFYILIKLSGFLLILLISSNSFAQCGGGGTNSGHLTMLPTFQTLNVNSGDRYTFDAYSQTTYVISFCQGGGNNTVDTQIEICDQNGNTVYEYNDDHCGLGSEVVWLCPANGTYSFVIHEYYCNDYGTPAGTVAYKTLTPPTEQDCLGAIPLCFSSYSNPNSYSGTGHYTGEIPDYPGSNADDNCPGNCLLDGELNDVWYTFTVQTSGTVSFTIIPNNSADDYDWAVYDITNMDCMDIAANADLMQESCNFCGTAGNTGPSGASTEDCQHGNSCTPFNDELNVTAGETYVVNVSNFSSTQSGYTINFGGTAQIVDNSTPVLEDIVYQPNCGATRLTVQFSERLWCQGTDVADFTVTGPNGNYQISDVWSNICLSGLGSSYSDTYYDDVWTLEMSDFLSDGGNYTITVDPGGVEDICGNTIQAGDNVINFNIDGVHAAASVIDGVTCPGDSDGSAQIDSVWGGTTPYSYLWSSGDTSTTATNLQAGPASITVTDSTGICLDEIDLNIPYPPPVNVDAGSDKLICGGDTVTLGGSPTVQNGTPPYYYNWTPGVYLNDSSLANPESYPLANMQYIIEVTDSSGCNYYDTVMVETSPPMSLSFNNTDVSCFGNTDGESTVNVSGGLSPFSYSWSNGLGNTQTVSGLSANQAYTVSITDSIGCFVSDTTSVNQPAQLVINDSVTDCNCGATNGCINTIVTGGTTPYSYSWSSGDTVQNISGLAPDTYSLTVTDANGCTTSDSFTVQVIGNISVSIVQTDSIYCYGETTAGLEANMPAGIPPLTYNWAHSGANNQTVSNLAQGFYSVTVTDSYGCSASDTITISQPPSLSMSTDYNDIMCAGAHDGTATVDSVDGGTAPYSYIWSTGDSTISLQNLEAGVYSVTVTDYYNCEVSEFVTINEPSDPVQVFIKNKGDALCKGSKDGWAVARAMGGVQPYTISWKRNNNIISFGDSVSGLKAGDYSVNVEDDNTCIDSRDFTIKQPQALEGNFSVSKASCRDFADGGASVSIEGGTYPYNYRWSTGDTSAILENVISGDYRITVTDYHDCKITLDMYIPENPQICLEIPNAFTPNDDGVNDKWIIEYFDQYPRAVVFVFNRWGQKLYAARHGDEPWDGKYNGKLVPAGTYTYVVDLNNTIEPYTGTVTVVY